MKRLRSMKLNWKFASEVLKTYSALLNNLKDIIQSNATEKERNFATTEFARLLGQRIYVIRALGFELENGKLIQSWRVIKRRRPKGSGKLDKLRKAAYGGDTETAYKLLGLEGEFENET